MIESPLLPHLQGYIAGQWRDGNGTIDVTNPATGELLAKVSNLGNAEARAAIDAAEAALREPVSLDQRAKWLAQIADALIANKPELARIITLEQGKPLKESTAEVDYSAAFFRFFSTQLHHLTSQDLPERIKNFSWTIHHRPAGVAAMITPWNFPLAMISKKLSAAIGAGCSIVTKPAEITPLTCIALWHLLERTGIPAGWLNLVIGAAAPIGDVLCSHPAVRIVSFTGSTATGRVLIAKTAPHVKRLHMELGGNAPYIVFDDADIPPAIDALMANKFRCAGQTCVCANRIMVHSKLASDFTDAAVERVAKLRVGNGLEPETDIGPLINAAAVEKVQRHVTDALSRGAKRVVGGNPRGGPGHFYQPSVLTGATSDMLLSREETFGPIVAVSKFDTDREIIDLANSTPYGLAAYVFTRDLERAQRIASQIRFGHVGINTGMGPTPEAPFGGMKQSGFGREGGVEGLLDYCESQTVVCP